MTKLEKLLEDEGFTRRDLSKMKLQVLCELQDVIDLAEAMKSFSGSDEEKAEAMSTMIKRIEENADNIFKLCYTHGTKEVTDELLNEYHIPTKQISQMVLLEPLMDIFKESTDEVKEEGKPKRVTRRGKS